MPTTMGPTTIWPTTDWDRFLRSELAKPYWSELQRFVEAERATQVIHPPPEAVFAALRRTPLSDVKVVILGQDPYHGPGQANGLSFSVTRGVGIPPSLRNIFTELESDLGLERPKHGCLDSWADNGVLLLNTTLTVRSGEAASHQGHGWEMFTDQVIRTVNDHAAPSVFILWGASARRKGGLINQARHSIIESPHPSPLSALRGFFGSKPFSRANEALRSTGRDPVDWRIPD